MIAYTGQMGSGKSYSACRDMLSKLRSGHVVAANIMLKCRATTSLLKVPCVLWKQNYYFLGEDDEVKGRYHGINIYDYENYPCGSPRGTPTFEQDKVYIYWDEASSIFNSLLHVADANIKEVSAWACHTNKRGQELCVIMQFSSDLNKRIRNHVQYYKSNIHLGNMKIPLVGIRLPKIFGNTIMQTTYGNDCETRISTEFLAISPDIYNCYDTGQIVVGNRVWSKTASKNFQDIIKRQARLDAVLKMFLFSLLICIFLSIWGV